jgi:hypothetical protein
MADEVTPEQVQRFIDRGREFEKQLGVSFNAALQSAADRGLNFSNAATRVFIQECAPEAVYDLARPENEAYVRSAFNVAEGEPHNEALAADRARRHISQVRRNETYKVIAPQEREEDKYLRERRAGIRAGLRRR